MSRLIPTGAAGPLARFATPTLLVLLAACTPAATSAAPPPSPSDAMTSAPAPAPRDTGEIRVSGTAHVEVTPDRARLRFAMETEAPSAAEAADANAAQMNDVLAAVRAAVGDAGTIGTSGYGLSPVYNRPEPGGRQTITGYRAQNHVEVTLTDVDRVGAVLDAAVRAGANRVAELSFFASETGPARLEAIRKATAAAREEAEVLASALGGRLGAPLEVNLSGGGGMPPMYRMAATEALSMADTPVEVGSQRVTVSVNITFRLEAAGN